MKHASRTLPPGIEANADSLVYDVWTKGNFTCSINGERPPKLGVAFAYKGMKDSYPSTLLPGTESYEGVPWVNSRIDLSYGVAAAHLLSLMAVAKAFNTTLALEIKQKHLKGRSYGVWDTAEGQYVIHPSTVVPFELSLYLDLADALGLDSEAKSQNLEHWVTITASPKLDFHPEDWLQLNR